jgi:hypothetical protein
MTGVRKSTGGADELTGAGDELRASWSRFRAGEVVPCPVDQAPRALAVDASAGTYRFVCTQCGVASAWFESGPAGIQVRGHSDDEPHDGGP